MSTRTPPADVSEELLSEFGANASYVEDLLNRYRANPSSVDDEWRRYFQERFGAAPEIEAPPQPAPAQAPAAPPARPVPTPAATPAAAVPAVSGERVPLRGASARIAENMQASLTVPTATTQRQIPIKLLDENRRLINEARAQAELSKISFTHLVSWAVIQGVKAFPAMNDAFEAVGGEPARVRREEIRFGLAVDVAKSDGSRTLLVPNVKGAEKMTFREFVAASDDVITRARTSKLQVSDFEGTTISLTNPGTLGTSASVPRLMPGQGAIIATGAIDYPAEFAATAPAMLSRLAISKVVTFTSTYDHRIIQGAESGAFLARVEELLLGQHDFYDAVFADLGIPFRPLQLGDRPLALRRRPRRGHRQAGPRPRADQRVSRARAICSPTSILSRPRRSPQHPELELETYGLTIWDLDREFYTGGLKGGDRHAPARHHRAHAPRVLRQDRHRIPLHLEPGRKVLDPRACRAPRPPPSLCPRNVRKSILVKLIAAEEFERFLGTKFLGQRRYSVEGCETAIPLLDRLVEDAPSRGVDEIVIGMSHRGRLNILANVVGNSAERIFSGFEGVVHPDFPADEGDVKYHQGAHDDPRRPNPARTMAVQVESNPVAPRGRRPGRRGRGARQAGREAGHGPAAWKPVLPVLLHGDAAFAGQGMVAEASICRSCRATGRAGRSTSSSTTRSGSRRRPSKGRSSVYSTDVAKIIQVPIFHVNADDPEAAYRVLEIALDYRQEFHKDVVIDLIGFRRHGHNEGDEPTYTQPLMYQRDRGAPGRARRSTRGGSSAKASLTEEEVEGARGAPARRLRSGAGGGQGGREPAARRNRPRAARRARPASIEMRDGRRRARRSPRSAAR